MSVFAEFLVPLTSYPLGEYLDEYSDVSVEVERMVPTGGSTHYVWVRGENRADFIEELSEGSSVDGVAVVDELPDRTLVRFEWSSLESPLFELVEMTGVTLTGVHGTGDGWTIQLRLPDDGAFSAFYEGCREREIPIELRGTFESNGGTDDGPAELTDRQAETLEVAFEAGYFDVPRRITLAELADELGVSEQAVSERLRRGLSSLLTSVVLESDDSDTGA